MPSLAQFRGADKPCEDTLVVPYWPMHHCESWPKEGRCHFDRDGNPWFSIGYNSIVVCQQLKEASRTLGSILVRIGEASHPSPCVANAPIFPVFVSQQNASSLWNEVRRMQEEQDENPMGHNV